MRNRIFVWIMVSFEMALSTQSIGSRSGYFCFRGKFLPPGGSLEVTKSRNGTRACITECLHMHNDCKTIYYHIPTETCMMNSNIPQHDNARKGGLVFRADYEVWSLDTNITNCIDSPTLPFQGPLFVESPEGRYIVSFADAESHCENHGARLMTPAELNDAFNNEMSVCRCGWLSDGRNGYPIQIAHQHCGGSIGVHFCGRAQADVFCYKD